MKCELLGRGRDGLSWIQSNSTIDCMCADATEFIYSVKQKRTVSLVSMDKHINNNRRQKQYWFFRADDDVLALSINARNPSEIDAFWMTCDVQSCMKQKNSFLLLFLGLMPSNIQFVHSFHATGGSWKWSNACCCRWIVIRYSSGKVHFHTLWFSC